MSITEIFHNIKNDIKNFVELLTAPSEKKNKPRMTIFSDNNVNTKFFKTNIKDYFH